MAKRQKDKQRSKNIHIKLKMRNTNSTKNQDGPEGLGHIEWHIPSVILGKPDNKIHQTLIDMINDHSLEQIEDKPTRGERTFNLILTNAPNITITLEIMPPYCEYGSSHRIYLMNAQYH
jgi:hypothetical protein